MESMRKVIKVNMSIQKEQDSSREEKARFPLQSILHR